MRCPICPRAVEALVARPSHPRLKLLANLAGDGGIPIDVPLNSLKCIEPGHLHDTLNRRVAAPLTVIKMVFATHAAVAALRGTSGREPTRARRAGYRHIFLKAHRNASLHDRREPLSTCSECRTGFCQLHDRWRRQSVRLRESGRGSSLQPPALRSRSLLRSPGTRRSS